ncbi:MAG: hypothetical protein HY268_15710 [Deltaproteobacteria bacterium]|nr:hypothetical protein [Deltaproteobacteria bacterium]
MFFGFIPKFIPCQRVLAVLLLAGLCFSACVTQTERVGYYPHTRQEDESVWDEVRREFGWKKTPSPVATEPFYRRATRGVIETISGWFHKEDASPTGAAKKLEEAHGQSEDARKLEESRRQFEQKRQEALSRLREQQGQQD